MFRTASSVLHILPIAGLYTFLPKYLESQFRLAAHAANMISGNTILHFFNLLKTIKKGCSIAYSQSFKSKNVIVKCNLSRK